MPYLLFIIEAVFLSLRNVILGEMSSFRIFVHFRPEKGTVSPDRIFPEVVHMVEKALKFLSNTVKKLTNSLFNFILASVDTTCCKFPLSGLHCWLLEIKIGQRIVQLLYDILSTLADFSCCHWNAESATLTEFNYT